MAAGFDPKSDAVAARLRHHWRRDVPALYHGTDALGMILAQNTLRIAPHGDRCVSLTRSPAVAVYFAMLHRDQEPDAGVLILDRRRLNARYALDVRHAFDWDGCGNGTAPHEFDEAEEAVWTDIHGLDRFLLGVVPIHEKFTPDDVFAGGPALSSSALMSYGGR